MATRSMTRSVAAVGAGLLVGLGLSFLACVKTDLTDATCEEGLCGDPVTSGYKCCAGKCIHSEDECPFDTDGGTSGDRDASMPGSDSGMAMGSDGGGGGGGDGGLDGGVDCLADLPPGTKVQLLTPSVGSVGKPAAHFSWSPITLKTSGCSVKYRLYLSSTCPGASDNHPCPDFAATGSGTDLQATSVDLPLTGRTFWEVQAFANDSTTPFASSPVWYVDPTPTRSETKSGDRSTPVVRVIDGTSGQAKLSSYRGGLTMAPSTIATSCSQFGTLMTMSDLNGDGLAELVLVDGCTSGKTFLRAYGGDPLVERASLDINSSCASPTKLINAGDMDLDGDEEVVVQCGSAGVLIVRYDGSNTTLNQGAVMATSVKDVFALGDVTGDGHADLGITDATTFKMYVYPGTEGTGAVLRNDSILTTNSAYDQVVAIGDSNGNGLGEILVRSNDTVQRHELDSTLNFRDLADTSPSGCLELYPADDLDADGVRDALCRTSGSTGTVLKMLRVTAASTPGFEMKPIVSCADSMMTPFTAMGGYLEGSPYVLIGCETNLGIPGSLQGWSSGNSTANTLSQQPAGIASGAGMVIASPLSP